MNHTSVKRIVLWTAALVALFALFSVLAGTGTSTSRGSIAAQPCCQHQTPSQAAFPTGQQIAGSPCCDHHAHSQVAFPMGQQIAVQPCCNHHAPSQAAFQSTRKSGEVYTAPT